MRGFPAYRRAERVQGIATSEAASIAAGEVRLSGTIVPGPVLLLSPLQSVQCVYYRTAVSEQQGKSQASMLNEERSVGFSVRDATGEVRVVPRGARWFVEPAFKERTSLMGGEPAGLLLRERAWATPARLSREAAIADLLTVHPAAMRADGDTFVRPLLASFGEPRRTYVVALRRRIDRAWANIEVALRQRHDELPNLVSAVRGVMAFERGVLEEVVRQRARYAPSAPPAEQALTADATSAVVRSLLAVVEAYPRTAGTAVRLSTTRLLRDHARVDRPPERGAPAVLIGRRSYIWAMAMMLPSGSVNQAVFEFPSSAMWSTVFSPGKS